MFDLIGVNGVGSWEKETKYNIRDLEPGFLFFRGFSLSLLQSYSFHFSLQCCSASLFHI